MSETTRKVPKDALRFAGGTLTFAAPAEGEAGKSNRISMLARTAQPIYHWYWGRVVHDMAGMQLRKERAPIDWCHDDDQILGFLDEFQADPKTGLTVAGAIIPFREDDRATEILHKGRAGVPYEASIAFWGPKRVEEVGEGMSTEVNGYQFTGPGYVIREWTLDAVAICPYGADPNTRTQFSEPRDGEAEIEVCIFSQEPTMSTETKLAAADPTPPSETPPADPTKLAVPSAPPVEDPRAKFAAELKRYTDRFGAEKGAEWFTAGKTWEESLELHATQLAEASAAKDQQIAELSQKVGAAEALRGEAEPATFGDKSGAGDKSNRFANVLPDGAAAFAAGIKLPGKK